MWYVVSKAWISFRIFSLFDLKRVLVNSIVFFCRSFRTCVFHKNKMKAKTNMTTDRQPAYPHTQDEHGQTDCLCQIHISTGKIYMDRQPACVTSSKASWLGKTACLCNLHISKMEMEQTACLFAFHLSKRTLYRQPSYMYVMWPPHKLNEHVQTVCFCDSHISNMKTDRQPAYVPST